MTESERDPWLGRTLDSQYRVDELLGEGGMGRVYLAHHLDMDRQVVLKVIRTGLHDEKLRTRFRREGQLIARLRHPNIVQVYSAGETDSGELYLVMEYIPGRTLEAIIRDDGPVDEPRFLRLARQIAAAVASAHAEGIVHRDLKPANVLVTRVAGAVEHVKVLDFGIAKIVGGDELADAKLTKTGWLMGTPAYMSPEQIESRPVDARTDVYALGVIFDEMVTGANAYAAPTPMECFRRHLSMELEPVAERAPHVELSPRLEGIVARCLAKDPNLRFADASALLEALDDVTYDPARVTLRPMGTPTPSPRPAPPLVRRDPARVILAGVLLACVLVGALLIATLLSRGDGEVDETDPGGNAPTVGSDTKQPPARPPGETHVAPIVIGALPGPGAKPPPVWTTGSPASDVDPRLAQPVPVPAPTPEPVPVPAPTPEPVPVPAPTPEPEPVPAPTPEPEPLRIPAPAPPAAPSPLPPSTPLPAPTPVPEPPPIRATPALAPLPPAPIGTPTLADDEVYRIPLPPDARRSSDLGNLVVFRTGYGWTETCDAYHDAFAGGGAITSRHDEDYVCSVMSHDEASPFRMISIQREDDGGTSVKLFR